jgi:hypothetical protein
LRTPPRRGRAREEPAERTALAEYGSNSARASSLPPGVEGGGPWGVVYRRERDIGDSSTAPRPNDVEARVVDPRRADASPWGVPVRGGPAPTETGPVPADLVARGRPAESDAPELERIGRTELFGQMAERSHRRLEETAAELADRWLDWADWTLHQRVIVERHALTREIRRLHGYLRACQLRQENPRKELLADLWARIAEESHDVYAVATMGADPRRLARVVK